MNVIQRFIQKRVRDISKTFTRMTKKNNLPKVIMLIAILLVLIIIYKKYLVPNEGFTSNPGSFSNDIKSGADKQLVLFHANWCGYCQTLIPIWENLASTHNSDNTKMIQIDLGDDNAKTQQIMTDYEISAFPTIRIFENGQLSGDPYEGPRDEATFTEYVNSVFA